MKKRILSSLLILVMLLSLFSVSAFAAPDVGAYYVHASGSDTSGDGSKENPYASLAKAFGAVGEGETATIILLSDLTVTESARCTGTRKNITITSEEGKTYTITRGSNFTQVQDSARSTYNPAMIEIDGTLRVENLILDDNYLTAGENYIQASTTGDGKIVKDLDKDGNPTYFVFLNNSTVQDAIIATYDSGDEITLGPGAELHNFGGMSAVRLSGGKLTMENGSKIVGSKNFTTKGAAGCYGAAGAVWIQGGELVMNAGSQITDVNGRAVYLDGGKVTVNGTISNITANKNMWQGAEGVAAHVRNGGQFTLGSTGVIDGNNLNAVAVQVTGNTVTKDENGTPENVNFYMDAGSVIKNLTNDAIHLGGGVVYMDGEITNVNASQVMNLQGGVTTIGPNGNIHNNRSRRTTIYFQQSELYLYGKIHHNYSNDKSGGVEVNNNLWGEFTMYPGAEITDNYAQEHGAGVMVCNGTFTMEGGLIARNIAGFDGGGVCVRRGGQFIMEGGEIKDNATAASGGGVALATDEYYNQPGLVDLRGGTISGNKRSVTLTKDEAGSVTGYTGGIDNDLSFYKTGIGTLEEGKEKYLTISPAMTVDRNVYMSVDKKIVTVTDDTKLGNASSADITALKTASNDKGWSDPLATFWAQNANAIDATVRSASETSLFNADMPLYVLVKDGDTITSFKAKLEGGVASFSVPASANGVAVALVQPGADYGTLTLVANPVLVKDNEVTDGIFAITYTLTYEPSNNVLSSIGDIDNITLDVAGLTVTKDDLKNGFTRTWTAEDVSFVAGTSVEESARLNFTLGNKPVEVPSNLAVTRMIGSEPVTPDDDHVITIPVFPVLLNTEDHISYLVGYQDGTIRPEGKITRGEVATIFFRLLTQEARSANFAQTNPYSDVTRELWCNNAISTLSAMGIIEGYSDGTFCPNAPITRAEFAKIAIGFCNMESGAYQGTFTDVLEGKWYTPYVEAAAQAGLIYGADGKFRPGDNITRAEASAIVNRLLGRHPHKDHLLPSYSMINWPDCSIDAWYYADMMEATNSHSYMRMQTASYVYGSESWTGKLPQPDWTALEHTWVDAYTGVR